MQLTQRDRDRAVLHGACTKFLGPCTPTAPDLRPSDRRWANPSTDGASPVDLTDLCIVFLFALLLAALDVRAGDAVRLELR